MQRSNRVGGFMMVILICAAIFAATLIGVKLWLPSSPATPVRPVRHWFFVSFDDQSIDLRVESEHPWRATLRFDEIHRVCIKMEPGSWLGVSHGLYIWVRGRENSYAIPMDADASPALLKELTRRGLIPAELVIQAMGSSEGVFCWPSEEHR
jgi:hypothetical protein